MHETEYTKETLTAIPDRLSSYPRLIAFPKKTCLSLCLTLLGTHIMAQVVIPPSGIITTVVGNGTTGYTGDGGPALSAATNAGAVTVDSSGNIYTSEDCTIRETSAATGVINTIAGTGTCGYTGDGGAAINAEVTPQHGLIVDKSGNIYFSQGFAVREISASNGIVNTIAGGNNAGAVPVQNAGSGTDGDGGQATNALLWEVEALALDGSGNLYVATDSYYRIDRSDSEWSMAIRKVVLSSGSISTVHYGDPTNIGGIAVDAQDNVYWSENNGKVSGDIPVATNYIYEQTTSGAVSDLVSGSAGFSGDGGPATSAATDGPASLVFDPLGNLYFLDISNNRLRKISNGARTISTVAGNGSLGDTGDGGQATAAEINATGSIASDTNGSLYLPNGTTVRVVGSELARPGLTVSCSPNPLTYASQNTTCTSNLTGGYSPTGSIGWTINGAAWTTTPINGSLPGFVTGNVGTYTIGAAYSGDSDNLPTSATTTLTIVRATTSTALSCSPTTLTYGGTGSTCTASVAGSSETGTVTFYVDGVADLTTGLSGNTAAWGGMWGTGNAPETNSVTAFYNGDGNNDSSDSSAVSVSIVKATPPITVSCTNQPYPSLTNCTVQVSSVGNGATPSGSITYVNDGGTWGTVALNGGKAVGVGVAPAGSHTMVVTYSGDPNYNTASASTTYTEGLGTPTMTASCSPDPVGYRSWYICTASVGGGATGTVTWPAIFGSATTNLTGGTASTTALQATSAPGNYSGTVSYSGDSNYNPMSTTATITVAPAPTVDILTSALNPSSYGQSVAFSTLINTGGAQPVGTVTIEDHGASIGTASMSAVKTTNELPYSTNIGSWSYNSGLAETPNTAAPDGSNTATLLTVGNSGQYYTLQSFPCAPGVSTYSAWIKQGPNPSDVLIFSIRFFDGSGNLLYTGYPGGAVPAGWTRVSYSASAPANTASCEVGLEQDSAAGGGGTAAAGQNVYVWGVQFELASTAGPYVSTDGAAETGYGGLATFSTSSLASGAHPMTAVYGGDADTAASTSQALTQTVTAATPTLTLSGSGSPTTAGTSMTFTATISSGPTGTITFYDGSTSLGTGTISGTTASFATSSLALGTHSITAVWAGNTDYSAVTSNVVSQVIEVGTQTITFSAPASPVTYGVAPITLSATASSGLPVTFSLLSGPGTISGNTLTITGGGTVVLAANQAGNSSYSAAPQVTQSVVVNTAPLTVTSSSTLNPSVYGETATITFTFAGAGAIPTGSATIKIDGATVTDPTLNGAGSVSFTTAAALVAGSHTVTATFDGSANYH